MHVKTYSAMARRERQWWVVEVEGVGTTQARSTTEAHRMAADLVAVVDCVEIEDIRVEIEYELPGALGDEVRRARAETRAAELATRNAAEKIRQVVARIVMNGMSQQDAARIIGVSAQRINQLVRGVNPR